MAPFPVGYMASGAASAAALVAASRNPLDIAAIVSYGGRADLAGIRLHKVDSPTLLIVGGADLQGFEFNRWALRRLNCEKRIVVTPGASHRFDEPGTFQAATRTAREWFERFMKRPSQFTTRRSIFLMNFSERNSGRASM
jgi:putative phosphoribosyl transferase